MEKGPIFYGVCYEDGLSMICCNEEPKKDANHYWYTTSQTYMIIEEKNVFSKEKPELLQLVPHAKFEALKIVLSAMSEKANVSTKKMLELLEQAKSEVEKIYQ